MKCVLIDVWNPEKTGVVEVSEHEDFAEKYLNARCIDHTYRFIGNMQYCVICDDEGLLKNPEEMRFGAYATDIDLQGRPLSKENWGVPVSMLEGSILFCSNRTDDEGYGLDLTDKEIRNIFDHMEVAVGQDGVPHPTVIGLNYRPMDENNIYDADAEEKEKEKESTTNSE